MYVGSCDKVWYWCKNVDCGVLGLCGWCIIKCWFWCLMRKFLLLSLLLNVVMWWNCGKKCDSNLLCVMGLLLWNGIFIWLDNFVCLY